MAWLGAVREVQYYLAAVGADRGDDGRFVISGAPPVVGSEPDRVIIPDETIYYRHGIPFLLADAMSRSTYGTSVSGIVSVDSRLPNTNDGRYMMTTARVIKIGGVPYELPPGLRARWSPVNQAWIVTWGDTVLRVIGDRVELLDYLKELGAMAVNPAVNPRFEAHRAAYRDYLESASQHLDAALPLLEEGRQREALGAVMHAECDVRQAYTEAVYAKRDDSDLARMVTPLEKLHERLRDQIRLLQERL